MAKLIKYPMPRMTSVAELAAIALEGADGMNWYRDAGAEIARASATLAMNDTGFYYKPAAIAALLSLFSPRTSVTRSCQYAIHYARTSQFLPSVMWDIRRSVDHWEKTVEIRGPKTLRFYQALMGDQNACVLDTWMGIALGVDPKRFHDSKTVYAAGEKRIAKVAYIRGWTIAQTQAAIWTETVRRKQASVPALSLMPLINGIPI